MGAWVCKRADPEKVLFMGLDAAGKTTILYKMKLGEIVTTIPTIGFNVETVNIYGCEVTCWDVGGRDKIRPLYRHYMQNLDGAVFVIDSTDRERLEIAVDELFKFYFSEDESWNTVCMVLANKQDLGSALSAQQIEEALKKKMETTKLDLNQTIFVCPVSAVTGEGLYEAFQCFLEQVELKRKDKSPSGLISVDMEKQKEDAQKDSKDTPSTKHGLTKKIIRDPMKYLKSLLFY